jgi:hypothetical protein
MLRLHVLSESQNSKLEDTVKYFGKKSINLQKNKELLSKFKQVKIKFSPERRTINFYNGRPADAIK